MLDVHAPHEPIHGFRDFLLHLLTITVGLLIALGLENAAEAWHHRHQRREAEATIREELRENRAQMQEAQKTVHEELGMLVRVLGFLEDRSAGRAGDPAGLSLSFSEEPMQDSAWRTAASTGVLSYMNYGEVQRYALAYKEQDMYETLQQQTLDEYLQLNSYVVKGFDPARVTPEIIQSAMPDVRRAVAHLEGMLDVSRGALKAYDDALK